MLRNNSEILRREVETIRNDSLQVREKCQKKLKILCKYLEMNHNYLETVHAVIH